MDRPKGMESSTAVRGTPTSGGPEAPTTQLPPPRESETLASPPTVSVVIPAYNTEATIERALNSVYAQTYPNIIEVIVVDDGSTDRTAEIVKTKFPQVRYVYQENAGPGAARNHGVRLAQGELIAFLDADDFWLPHKTARQVEALLAHPAVGAVSCRVMRIRDGAPWEKWVAQVSRPGMDFWTFRPGARLAASAGAMIIKRQAYIRTGGMDETLRRSQDTEFIMRFLATGYTVLALREVLFVLTLSPASGTHRFREGSQALPPWHGIIERLAPNAKPPLGGLLSDEEYHKLLSEELYKYALTAIRFGAPAQAIPELEKACRLPLGAAAKLRCIVLLWAARALARLPEAFARLIRKAMTFAADLSRSLGRPYWEM